MPLRFCFSRTYPTSESSKEHMTNSTDPHTATNENDPGNDSTLSEWIAQHRSLFDVMPHHVWIAGPNVNKISYFNRRWFEFTGMPRREALADSGLATVHPEDLDLLFSTGQQARAILQSFDIDIRLRGRNGIYRWFNVRGAPSFDEHDQVVAWVGTNLDIDERRRTKTALNDAHERSSKLQAITAKLAFAATSPEIAQIVIDEIAPWLEAHHALLVIVDESVQMLQTIHQNGFAGFADNEMVVPVSLPAPTAVAFRENRTIALGSRTEMLALYPILKERLNRTGIQANVNLPLVVNGQPFGALMFGYARSRSFEPDYLDFLTIIANLIAQSLDRARLYEATQRQAEILEVRVQERTHELALRNEELEAFVYTASHDLRTPLHKLSMSGGLLMGAVASGNTEDAQWLVNGIENGVRRMDQLIKDLLNLSRAGRVPEDPSLLDLGQTVERVVTELVERLTQRNVNVETPNNWPQVLYPETELYQLVLNLIGNASRFAQTTVRASWGSNEDMLEFSVEDDGPGIAPEKREHVFQLFAKLDPSSNSTGVGLAIVKRISERHGGRVWITDSELGGARFVISIPKVCVGQSDSGQSNLSQAIAD
jgi:PAS domain S-box-containing protein